MNIIFENVIILASIFSVFFYVHFKILLNFSQHGSSTAANISLARITRKLRYDELQQFVFVVYDLP